MDDSLPLSIVLPCYNEAGNLPKIYAVLSEILTHQPGVEVLLVNNGSTDRSAAVFAELQATHTLPIRVVEIAQNQGYGHGILTGVRAARGEFIAWSHADLQTDPRDILAAYEKLLQSAHPEKTVVKGRRKNRPLVDEFFTAGMAWLSSAALGQWLHDINAQPKLFPRSFVPLLDHAPTDFSLDLFFLYEAKTRGYTVLEQEVVFGKREHGEAKGGGTMKGKVKLIKRTLAYIFALRRTLKTSHGNRRTSHQHH
ncbi:glycosyltransferase family 2 protein [Armatimonas rosea]|uniref:Glycosyltransferase involved in cell wall biosynthesis n=1 Tax=Armatimonas rosea TaxID=685828 RepID=A0A7W9SL93_ARMRO|nr:glycosyltransferase family 2 protein [Armatimonas rosea]MBB6048680.1 glycosyltransferase involved in cell wall biosynthesis [Armatimonas rosea]